MILFWIIALLMVAAALAFVLIPLLTLRVRKGVAVDHDLTNLTIYRDQLAELESDLSAGQIDHDQYETAKKEIERRVLDEASGVEKTARADSVGGSSVSPAWIASVAAIIPLLALSLYLVLGTPTAVDRAAMEAAAAAQGGGQHSTSPEQVEAMIAKLKERLAKNPEDVEGWMIMVRSYAALGRHREAAQAFREIIPRVPEDAQMFADYADILAMSQGRKLTGEPEKYIQKALELDPKNIKALALAGTVAFEARDYKKAAATWQRALEAVPTDSPVAQNIKNSIAEAEARSGGKPPSADDKKEAAVPSGTAVQLAGRLELSPEARQQAGAEDTVFLLARGPEGRMPVAVRRLQVKDLPLNFVLDDSHMMQAGSSLSSYPELRVVARLSKAGTAMPGPGDWEAIPVTARPGDRSLILKIDQPVK